MHMSVAFCSFEKFYPSRLKTRIVTRLFVLLFNTINEYQFEGDFNYKTDINLFSLMHTFITIVIIII